MPHSLPKPTRNLVTKHDLRNIIYNAGQQIARKLARKHVVMIPVLTGGLRFASRLLSHLEEVPLQVVPVVAQGCDGVASKEPQIDHLRLDARHVAGNHVLLVDDVLDSGKTLWSLTKFVISMEPASITHAVMLKKRGRQISQYDVNPEFIGTEIPDEFVVGMGLDYQGFYRNLSYIGVLGAQERQFVDEIIQSQFASTASSCTDALPAASQNRRTD